MRCWGDWCDVGAIGAMLGPLERYWSDVRAIGVMLVRCWGDVGAIGAMLGRLGRYWGDRPNIVMLERYSCSVSRFSVPIKS